MRCGLHELSFINCTSSQQSWCGVVIAIEEKLEALKRIKNGEILRTMVADFGAGVSTFLVRSR